MTSLRIPGLEDLHRHLEWLTARSDRKARHRRVIDALDKHVPKWEELLKSSELPSWLMGWNPQTRRSRVSTFNDVCEGFDERSLVVLLRMFRAQLEGRKDFSFGAPLGAEGVRRGDVLFERYEVHDLLGVGGFAEVFLVAYIAPGEWASFHALKLRRLAHASRGDEQLFREEARILMGLPEHTNLMTAQFLEKTANSVCVVSEVILPDNNGRVTLGDHARTEPISLAQQLRWAFQCCEGLQCAYDHGIRAHRDIKPSNILIDWNLQARVSDFGLALIELGSSNQSGNSLLTPAGQSLMSPAQAKETVGSPAYMAPEQFSLKRDCDVQSDIYSLGISLYEVASGGRLPFLPQNLGRTGGEDRGRVFAAMEELHRTAPLPPLDTPLFPIIARCCAKEPEDRFANMQELREALLHLANRVGASIPTLPEKNDALELANRVGNQANAHARLGEHEQAVALYRKAHELFPLGPSIFNSGLSLMELGRYEEALAAFNADLQGPRAQLKLVIGICTVRVHGWRAGLPHIEEAARDAPNDPLPWENLLYGYEATGEHSAALKAVSELVRLVPSKAEWPLRKAELEMQVGRTAQAYASIGSLRNMELSPKQQERLGKLRKEIQQLAVLSRANTVLGPGYNQQRLRAACDAALDAARQARGNQRAAFVEALRKGNPSVLHSKAEELYRQVFGNA